MDVQLLLNELTWRGLVHEHTPNFVSELASATASDPLVGYVGFDPTAPSLQVGNLVPIMLLAHLQRAGGRPIVVMGGGTGMIGDPSGKSAERPLLATDVIRENAERQGRQFARFLRFDRSATSALMVDNATWLSPLGLLDFLRDVGKHFTVSYMLQKESVKARLDAGISFTEFAYMLTQAYDFLELFQRHGCLLQMGGSDQWGNITAGIELIRRVAGGKAHGLVAPLITTSSGTKFGKSEGEAVWLDPERTSPYAFYQFWINQDDRDVEAYLKMFTFQSAAEIAEVMRRHADDPGARIPHHVLAGDVTARVHGDEAAREAADRAARRFGAFDPRTADAATLADLATQLPSGPLPAEFSRTTSVVDLVVRAGIAKSKSEARRLIQQRGITVNGEQVVDVSSAIGEPLPGGYYWVTRGKKNDFLFRPPA